MHLIFHKSQKKTKTLEIEKWKLSWSREVVSLS